MPVLLQASNLLNAHIIRGRLAAEGIESDVAQENLCQLWGLAAVGGPILIVPEADFPQAVEIVATAGIIDPPPEVENAAIFEPPSPLGFFDVFLISGTLTASLALTIPLLFELNASIKSLFLNSHLGYHPEIRSHLPPLPELAITIIFIASVSALTYSLRSVLLSPMGKRAIVMLYYLPALGFLGLLLGIPVVAICITLGLLLLLSMTSFRKRVNSGRLNWL